MLGLAHERELAKVWETGVLSLRFPSARLGHEAASGLYEDLGRRQGPALAMQQALADRLSGLVAIDVRAMGMGSAYDGLASRGHELSRLGGMRTGQLQEEARQGVRRVPHATFEVVPKTD